MRKAVADAFAGGCDMPSVTLKVDFVNCADTEEYSQYAALQNIFLGDSVRVIARKVGVSVSMRATQYTYNCLTRKYTELTLGTVADTLENNTISAKQIPGGSITGAKLAGIGANVLFISPEKLAKKTITDENRPDYIIHRFIDALDVPILQRREKP